MKYLEYEEHSFQWQITNQTDSKYAEKKQQMAGYSFLCYQQSQEQEKIYATNNEQPYRII